MDDRSDAAAIRRLSKSDKVARKKLSSSDMMGSASSRTKTTPTRKGRSSADEFVPLEEDFLSMHEIVRKESGHRDSIWD